MIRAIRPAAVARDDASLITGWNIAPNVGYTVTLSVSASAVVVILSSADGSDLIGSGLALVGTDHPVTITPVSGQTAGMVDADLGWHLLVTSSGTEGERTITIDPMVDLADEIHPIYTDDDMALARATAAINSGTCYVDDVGVVCPLGVGAGIGAVTSVPVDGAAVVGQIESVTWSGTPDGTSETAVIRRHTAIAPEAYVPPLPPPVLVDDTAETDAATTTNGNVLTNDSGGTLTVSAVNGLSTNVGQIVSGSNGGDFVINADGSWTFDPSGDFESLNGTDTATTSVAYHASNGSAEARATVTVTVSAAGGVLWTPAAITTEYWSRADGDGGGAAAADWTDLSGNSRTPAQSTETATPTHGANVMTFDGGDYLRFPGSNVSDFALKFGTESFAILCVVNPAAVNRNPHIIFGARGYGAGWFFGLSNAAPYMRMYNAAEIWTPSPVTGVTISTGLQMLGATAPRGTTGKFYRNGNVVGSTSAVVGTKSMANSRYTHVGCYSDDADKPAGHWLGGIHEILIMPGVVSLADWQRAEGYLAHRWDDLLGVTTLVEALPSNHPYKTSAPRI